MIKKFKDKKHYWKGFTTKYNNNMFSKAGKQLTKFLYLHQNINKALNHNV